jgi:hypothetical protein
VLGHHWAGRVGEHVAETPSRTAAPFVSIGLAAFTIPQRTPEEEG